MVVNGGESIKGPKLAVCCFLKKIIYIHVSQIIILGGLATVFVMVMIVYYGKKARKELMDIHHEAVSPTFESIQSLTRTERVLGGQFPV